MIAPPLSAASIRRAASCAQKKTASRLVASTRRHSAAGKSIARVVCATPALLTRMVTVPKAFSAWSKAAFICAGSSMSVFIAMARPPVSAMRAASAVILSCRRAASTTAAPFAASTSAKRAPSPLEAPVTSATRPVRSNSSAAFITRDAPMRGANLAGFRRYRQRTVRLLWRACPTLMRHRRARPGDPDQDAAEFHELGGSLGIAPCHDIGVSGTSPTRTILIASSTALCSW